MRYFATKTPSVALYTGKGPVIKWPSPGGFEGMIEVNDKDPRVVDSGILKSLETCIATGTGGDIREVSADEYGVWQKKTSGLPTPTPRRDEISGGVAHPTDGGKRRSSSPSPAPAAAANPPPPIVPPPAAPEAHPVLGTLLTGIPTRRRGS